MPTYLSEDEENDALENMLGDMGVDDAVDTWRAILNDIKRGGPLARVLLMFHSDATDALRDLTICSRNKFKTDKEHSLAITELQERIQRFLATMVSIHTFRDIAKGVDATDDLSEEDDKILAQLIEE